MRAKWSIDHRNSHGLSESEQIKTINHRNESLTSFIRIIHEWSWLHFSFFFSVSLMTDFQFAAKELEAAANVALVELSSFLKQFITQQMMWEWKEKIIFICANCFFLYVSMLILHIAHVYYKHFSAFWVIVCGVRSAKRQEVSCEVSHQVHTEWTKHQLEQRPRHRH